MKKYLAALIVILICMFVPMHTWASQSAIETTVPTTHTVAIEAEHASALYVEGDKGLSSAYPVPRFSTPQFKITAEDGYTIKSVLLNGVDVTKEIKKDILKLSEVCENQVIEIETEAISQETPQTPQYSEDVEETVQNQETKEQLPETKPSKAENETNGSNTEKEQEATGNTQEEADTENLEEPEEIGQTTSEGSPSPDLEENTKHSNFPWIALLLPAGAFAGIIFFIIKKKKR